MRGIATALFFVLAIGTVDTTKTPDAGVLKTAIRCSSGVLIAS